MLEMDKQVIYRGRSLIDGEEVCTFHAHIDCHNPNSMPITIYQANSELYKANREQCRADQAEFEDYVYAKQDELLATEQQN